MTNEIKVSRTTFLNNDRRADYYLSYKNDSVFMDFNNFSDALVCLVRISFDGYGCCNLNNNSIPLNKLDSKEFKFLFKEKELNQLKLLALIKKAIILNKNVLWLDALKEYELI